MILHHPLCPVRYPQPAPVATFPIPLSRQPVPVGYRGLVCSGRVSGALTCDNAPPEGFLLNGKMSKQMSGKTSKQLSWGHVESHCVDQLLLQLGGVGHSMGSNGALGRRVYCVGVTMDGPGVLPAPTAWVAGKGVAPCPIRVSGSIRGKEARDGD